MSDPSTVVPSVVREQVVHAPVTTCFDTFVDGFASWWPPEHHIGDRTIVELRIEPFEGGRCYDVDTEGGECHWGTVLLLDRPNRLKLAWHIQGDWSVDPDPVLQSEVDVTFAAVDDTTTVVRLEHGHLDRHRGGGEGVHAGVSGSGGWMGILLRFGDRVEGREPRPIVGG